tara:strand:- start:1673 stop:2326 length:654 start_codon:yes stop_codon:yes gene_type:complete
MKFYELTDFEIGEYSNKKITLCSKCDNKKPIRFQIPKLYLPFGLSEFKPSYGPSKYYVDFSFKGWDQDESIVKKFYDFIRDIEDKIVKNLCENSEKIFGEVKDYDNISKKFNSNIKMPKNGMYAPNFKVKCDDTFIYDSTNKLLTDEKTAGLYMKKSASAILELSSVYFMNGQFGLVWKCYQLKLFDNVDYVDPDVISDDEEEVTGPPRLTGFQFKI